VEAETQGFGGALMPNPVAIHAPKVTVTGIFLSPCFCLSASLVALRPLDEKNGVKKMGAKR
jgi:hypothetical protein